MRLGKAPPPAVMKRPRAFAAILCVLGLFAAACGGSAEPAVGSDTQSETGALDGSSPGVGPLSPRPDEGIAATGGTRQVGTPCDARDTDESSETLTIAWVSPKIEELAAIGLETLIFDDPSLIVEAYINALNSSGGIGGRCLVYSEYLWGLVDPESDFEKICTRLPQEQPLLLLALALDETTLQCVTIASGIPTLGLFTTLPASLFTAADGLLFADQGSRGHLAAVGLAGALQSGSITPSDTLGLLYESGPAGAAALQAMRAESRRLGLKISAEAAVPDHFGVLEVLLAERRVGLLRDDLSDEEAAAAERALKRQPPEMIDTFREMEELYQATAQWFQVSGVSAVVATAGWSDVRRLMRAAEMVDWYPSWVINDGQPASLVLTEVPRQQGMNLLQVSHRRAAGDEIPRLDQGCVILRNTAVETEPFSHRIHSDAWNLINATCDYLDVVFGSLARIDGPVTREAFVEALAATDYRTASGSRIVFSSEDRFGADEFRILRADPDCVLNAWGCMRAVSDWIPLSGTAAGEAG